MKVIELDYSTLITQAVSVRNLPLQFIETADKYEIFALDGAGLLLETSILKDSSDGLSFETNYKPTANITSGIPLKTVLTDLSKLASQVSTQLVPTNANRRYLFIQNVGNSSVWINFTSVATIGQPSVRLEPGASFVMEGSSVTVEAVNVIAVAPNTPVTVKEK